MNVDLEFDPEGLQLLPAENVFEDNENCSLTCIVFTCGNTDRKPT